MGLGFTISLTVLGSVRELLGSGQIFKYQLLPLADAAAGKAGYTPISIFILAPGAFLVLAVLVATMNFARKKMEAKGKPLAPQQGCLTGECEGCAFSSSCSGKSSAVSGSKA